MRPSDRTGFTVVECMVVVSILVILAMLLAPVLSNAKRRAITEKSVAQMRQWQLAVNLYQQAWSDPGEESSGEPWTIGLPPSLVSLAKHSNLPLDLLKTGGVPEPGMKSAVYRYFPPSKRESEKLDGQVLKRWLAHYQRRGGDPILIADLTQNDSTIQQSPFKVKSAMGIYMQGELRRIARPGLLGDYEVWE